MNYHQKCEESATGLWSIEGELQQAKLLGRASRWNAEIYSFDGACSPALMREVCRLRCESYADVGVRIDDLRNGDAADVDGTYHQLIIWDCQRAKIAGGYRYAVGGDVSVDRLSISRYYRLSSRFVEGYLPCGVELGRSFVTREYKLGANMLTIYALDALWEGLAMVVKSVGAGYLFGRVTLYPSLGIRARNLLVGFMHNAFAPRETLMTAYEPLKVGISCQRYRKIFIGDTVADNYRILRSRMKAMRRAVPPIISSYMRLSPTMQVFDAYANDDLGGVAECAILLTLADFYDSVKRRYSL